MSRHGLPPKKPAAAQKNKRWCGCGEVAGTATGECAAVVCCCPLATVDTLSLALYKAPAGMCKKAMEKRKEKEKERRVLKQRAGEKGGGGKAAAAEESVAVILRGRQKTAEEAAMEEEMFNKFKGTGFWRSVLLRGVTKPDLVSFSHTSHF